MQGALIGVRIAEHRTLLWDHPSSLRHHSKWGGPDLLAGQIAPPVEYEQITSFVSVHLIAARCVHRQGDHRSLWPKL